MLFQDTRLFLQHIELGQMARPVKSDKPEMGSQDWGVKGEEKELQQAYSDHYSDTTHMQQVSKCNKNI